MAEKKLPSSINTVESDDMQTVEVKLLIPGIEVSKSGLFSKKMKLKQEKCEVEVKYHETSLEVSAKIKNGGSVIDYEYRVNKLPGEIEPSECKTEYNKEMVILKLKKKEESTWAVLLSKNGLDQEP